MKRYYFYVVLLVIASSFLPPSNSKSVTNSQDGWSSLFNGKDLQGWDVYLKDIGANNDPQQVFSVTPDGSEKVIRVSGETIGGIATKKEFTNYHFQLQFKWGSLTWGAKKGKKKDSGLLYHSVGENGADNGAWMRSHEFQIEETNTGDYWGCAGATADMPAIKTNDSSYTYDPAGALYHFRADNNTGRHCIKAGDAEKPTGEWNTLDLYCHGDTAVHVVNGKTVMILYHCAQVDAGKLTPLIKGRIQLQSEGAEVFYKNIRIKPIGYIDPAILHQQPTPTLLKTPAIWQFEQFPLPPGFAPTIKYKGIEELRFAPGMFKKEAPDYFTYAFAARLDNTKAVSQEEIKEYLLTYFKGLCSSTAKDRKLPPVDTAAISVSIEKGKAASQYDAVLHVFGVFTDGAPVTLNMEIKPIPDMAGKKTILLFIASPQPKTDAIWQELYKVQKEF